MPSASFVRECSIERSARIQQLEGLFDIEPSQRSSESWDVELPIESKPWNIGAIIGPSGSGKSTLLREMFDDAAARSVFQWSQSRSIVDEFPERMSIKDITMLLSSVGFSSPPAWVRPFHVLSNGEQFRVTVARALAENPDELFALDEFSSVVDRTVAKIGSAAIAKTVRRRKQQLVVASCHYDVIDWLQPDWIFDPSTKTFQWRELQRRPPIKLSICRVHHSAWAMFKKHHYLTNELSKSAVCFVGFVDKIPAVFHSYLPFVGKLSYGRAYRGHRSVCLPDFQGVGIGHAMITTLAAMWAGLGYRVFRNTGHPAEIAAAARDALWHLIRQPGRTASKEGGNISTLSKTRAARRMTASFEYVGDGMKRPEAAQLLESWA